jgi:hypothetical protein
MLKHEYLSAIAAAGFARVSVLANSRYASACVLENHESTAHGGIDKVRTILKILGESGSVRSITVHAEKLPDGGQLLATLKRATFPAPRGGAETPRINLCLRAQDAVVFVTRPDRRLSLVRPSFAR